MPSFYNMIFYFLVIMMAVSSVLTTARFTKTDLRDVSVEPPFYQYIQHTESSKGINREHWGKDVLAAFLPENAVPMPLHFAVDTVGSRLLAPDSLLHQKRIRHLGAMFA